MAGCVGLGDGLAIADLVTVKWTVRLSQAD
jgi:hypothetical protein